MTVHVKNLPTLSAGDLLFCPGGDEERSLRERITQGRDIALRRAESDRPDHIRAIYWQAVDFANGWITRPSAIDHLRLVRYALARFFLLAGSLEREAEHAE